MNAFWLITAVMLVAALVLLIPVLLRKRNLKELDRDAQNVRIARERLAELEAERREGVLSDEEFEQGKVELEQALLVDLGSGQAEQTKASPVPGRAAAGSLFVLVPLAAVGLYLVLGAPEHLDVRGPGEPARQIAAHGSGGQAGELPPVEEMVEGLQQRLAEDPDDPNGWYLLGRTYMSMARYQDAAQAFDRVLELAGDHPRVLVSLADALAMASDGDMSGRPTELVDRALELAPEDTTALWMAALAAEERGELEQSLTYLRRLEPLLVDQPEARSQVRGLIVRVQGGLGEPAEALPPIMPAATPEPAAPPAARTAGDGGDAAGRSLTVRVSLAEPVREQAAADDTVFVFAQAAEGPPMPLAVARKKVRDLPVTVVLDDSMAMMPAMSLSKFDRVRVAARISKSGSAQARSGDLQSDSVLVADADPGTVELVIAQPVP
jgi:cytochrome c-type biogenesis protein CcmH